MHFFRDNSVSFVLESSCIFIYTAVLGFGILRRSTSCIHAVVRAVTPFTHEKITIFNGARKTYG
jgi:hypothetical protein